MGTYAKIQNGRVQRMIKADWEYISALEDRDSWVKTSYNTFGGVHVSPQEEARPYQHVIYSDGSTDLIPLDQEIDSTTTYVISTGTLVKRFPDGGTAIRGNYAAVGDIYDAVNDVFYPPPPFASWHISSATNWQWEPPHEPTRPLIESVWHEPSQSWLYPLTRSGTDVRDLVTWCETHIQDPELVKSFLPVNRAFEVESLLAFLIHGETTATEHLEIKHNIVQQLRASTQTQVVAYIERLLADSSTYHAVVTELQLQAKFKQQLTTATQVVNTAT